MRLSPDSRIIGATPNPSAFHDPTLGCVEAQIVQPPKRLGSIGCLADYDIIRRLGEGGMGIVLLGRHHRTGELVALKMLRPEYRDRGDLNARFIGEAKFLRRLVHPHIVPLKGLSEETPDLGMVMAMPYYPLGSLVQHISRQSPVNDEEIFLVTTQIADALSHAHALGVIHYDLKPGNILFESVDHVRLADFGLAKNLSGPAENKDRFTPGEGTAPYLSPAMASGKAEDTRADIYALGAVLYEMLTGHPPYTGESREAIREAIVAGPPRSVAEANTRANPNLSRVCQTAMQARHEDRYPSIDALREDLRLSLSPSISIVAADLPAHDRASWRRRIPRNRGLRWGLGLGLTAMLWLALTYFQSTPALVLVDEIVSHHVSRWSHTHIAEWNGLPGGELLTVESDSAIIFDRSGELIDTINANQEWAEWTKMLTPMDINGDGRQEVPLLSGSVKRLECQFIGQQLRVEAQFTIAPSPADHRNANFTSELVPQLIITADKSTNGKSTLIAMSATYYSDPAASPWLRGLHAFDVATGEELWRVLSGPPPSSVIPVNLDSDSNTDFVFGTSSVRNGNVGPDDSRDFVTYAYGVSGAGTVLWRRQLGGEYDSAKAIGSETNSDGEIRVYIMVLRGEFGNEAKTGYQSRLVTLDSSGEQIDVVNFDTPIQDGLTSDLDQDGQLEVYALDRSGRVYRISGSEVIGPVELAPITGKWQTPLDRVLATFVGAHRYLPGETKLLAIALCERFHHGSLNEGDHSLPPTVVEHRNRRVIFLNKQLEIVSDNPLDHSQSPVFSTNIRPWDRDGLLAHAVRSDQTRSCPLKS